MLRLDNIHFSYSDSPLIKGVSFCIKRGEIVSLIGSSGSGKTSLFRIITGMLAPQQGYVEVDGIAHPHNKSQITYMQQEDLLLPWRTVLNNLLLFAELGQKPKSKQDLLPEAMRLLNQVGLEGCESYYPDELSGGMRQRVSLARALLQKRPLLLLDEPFGSLDVIIREELYTLLREIALTEGKTILFVTHDFRDALALSNRILILKKGIISKEFQVNEELNRDPVAKETLTSSIRHALQTLTPHSLSPA
jgi:NitT/TauT family transport system ATP-binding protein